MTRSTLKKPSSIGDGDRLLLLLPPVSPAPTTSATSSQVQSAMKDLMVMVIVSMPEARSTASTGRVTVASMACTAGAGG